MNAPQKNSPIFDMERLKRLQRREYLAYSVVRKALHEWDREDFDAATWEEMARSYMDRVEKDE